MAHAVDPTPSCVALGQPLLDALAHLATVPNLLVCSDFDGTLAPIVTDPAQARALPECVAALRALAALPATTAAVVSGRARPDLARLSGLGDPVVLVGSHGAEFSDGVLTGLDADRLALREKLLGSLHRLLEGIPGVMLEEKPASIAVHVRQASRTDAARALDAVRSGPGARPGVHLTAGHEVLELSVVAADKGDALDALRQQANADAVLFVGDDVTDERAFARLQRADVGVKVGPGDTLAQYRVADPLQVAALLAELHTVRAATPSAD